MTFPGDEPARLFLCHGVVAWTSRHNEDIVMRGQVLAKLRQELARRGAVRVEVLIEDEDPHASVR